MAKKPSTKKSAKAKAKDKPEVVVPGEEGPARMTLRLMTAGAFKSLNNELAECESRTEEVKKDKDAVISEYVKEKHLHKQAHKDYKKLSAMKTNNGAVYWAHLVHMLKLGGIIERWTDQQEMFDVVVGDGKPGSAPNDTIDPEPRHAAAPGRQPTQAADVPHDDDGPDLRPAHLREITTAHIEENARKATTKPTGSTH